MASLTAVSVKTIEAGSQKASSLKGLGLESFESTSVAPTKPKEPSVGFTSHIIMDNYFWSGVKIRNSIKQVRVASLSSEQSKWIIPQTMLLLWSDTSLQ